MMIHNFVVSKKIVKLMAVDFDLGQSRFFSWNITPFLDDWFLHLSGIASAPGANFFGNVNAFLLRFQKRNKFGDELASLLGFEVTSFFRHLGDDSLLSIETFLWARLGNTATRSAKLSGNLFAFGLGCVFFDRYGGFGTFSPGPFATLLLSSVTLSNIFAFFVKDFFAFNNIVFNVMLMISSFAVGFINGFTFFGTFTFADQRGVAKFNFFFTSGLLVFNETRFGEGLVTFFLLLGLEIGSVGGVAFLIVTMFASDDFIIFGLLLHNNFIDTSLSSSSNGANA